MFTPRSVLAKHRPQRRGDFSAAEASSPKPPQLEDAKWKYLAERSVEMDYFPPEGAVGWKNGYLKSS